MKRLLVVIVAITLLVMSLVGCSGNREQDIETILGSELLRSYGIDISIPESPYYNFLDSRFELEVALHVPGEHGSYYFTPGGWTDELIARLVQVSEAGIHFAKDFLGIEVSRPLSFVFNVTEPTEDHPMPMWGGGGVFDTSTFISMEARLLPSLVVHEAVHTILEYADRRSNFPLPPEGVLMGHAMFLEEGLCDVIDFLFARETEHSYRTNYGDNIHTDAIRAFRFHDNFADEAEFGTRYPELMSYQTAASFIYFLLEHHGTMEDFMRVFDDIYLMEEVYGWDMAGMIQKWMVYLEQFR